MSRVAIVILNWNGKHFMEKYLPALLASVPGELGEIVIADNGSTDGSAEWLKENFILRHEPDTEENIIRKGIIRKRIAYQDIITQEERAGKKNKKVENISKEEYSKKAKKAEEKTEDVRGKNIPSVKLITFDRNWGFTGGYNRALAQLDTEYFLLLNSDVRVPGGWLEPLVNFMDTHPAAGICMPKILREEPATEKSDPAALKTAKTDCFEYAGASGGFIDKYGFPFCRGRILSCVEEDRGQYDTAREVFWASGAAMMIRSALYRELGGLDERFFAHMEEIDLCWRAKLLGHQVWVVPQSRVYHVGGGTLPNNSPRKLYFNYRNNLLMLYKNLPPKGASWETMGKKGKHNRNLFIFKRKCIDGLSALVYLLQGKFADMRAVYRAHRDYEKMKNGANLSPRSENATTGNATFGNTSAGNTAIRNTAIRNTAIRNTAARNATTENTTIENRGIVGIYKKSIILSFFLGRKRFSQLGEI